MSVTPPPTVLAPTALGSLASAVSLDRRTAAKPIVGLELVEGAIRWVELALKGTTLRCTAHGELVLAPDEPPGTQLQRALIKAGVTARRAAIAVPRHLVILRELELPPGPRHELAAMVALKLERELPFPVAEMALALRTDATLPSGTVRVLAAYVRKEALEKSLAVARAAGLEPVSAGVSAIAALRLAPADRAGGATALVAVGPRMTEIAIRGTDGSMLSRAASAGAGGLAPDAGQDAPGNRAFLDELDRTFKSFAGGAERTGRVAAGSGAPANAGAPASAAVGAILDRTFASAGPVGAETRTLERVGQVWLAGLGASTPGLDALVTQRFGVPTQRLDPLAALALGNATPTLAVAVGVAIAVLEDRPRLDFIPPRTDWRTTFRPNRTALAIAAAVAVVVGVFVLPPLHFAAMEAEIDDLRKTEVELTATNKELAVFRDRVLEVAPWAGGRSPWLAAIGELAVALDTRKAYFTSLKANDGEQRLTVLGKAVSTSECTRLRDRIDALSAFDATLRGTSIQPDKGGYPIHFTLEIQFAAARLDPVGPKLPAGAGSDAGAGSGAVGSGSAAGSGSDTEAAGSAPSGSGSDAMGSGSDAMGSGSDAVGSGSDAVGSGSDAVGSGSDAVGSGSEAVGSGADATGSGADTAGSGSDGASPGSGSAHVSSSGAGSNAGSGSAAGSGAEGSGSGRGRRRDRR